jgi:serine/threonine-protein kinase
MSDKKPSPALLRLADMGRPEGPSLDEAIGLFAQLRRSPEEGAAIKTLLARSTVSPLPEPLLVLAAAALVDRGEQVAAEQLLRHTSGASALMLRADLRERGGDLAGAVALWERVLLRDIDWPGARERLVRARAALGLELPRQPRADATIAAPRPDAPFRLLREIARGGAGAVFEAEDVELKRKVALKVYHHRADRDRAQLLHEARVAVALAGPGVIRVFDVDPDRGWLAMEWTKLGAMRARLDVPLERWGLSLARALARVHAAGWVHHDVKPANVLLRAEDEPVLSDFGIARRVGEPSPPGSLGYVSPERMRGRNSDPRDDIYGYGRMLEDACHQQERSGDAKRWLAVAALCVGPDEERPKDASTLVDTITTR